MPIRFLKNASEIADVSRETPLPVYDTNREVQLRNTDPLLVRTQFANPTPRDLLGTNANDNPDLPTLDNCLKYHTLLWNGRKMGAGALTYTVQARCGDSLDTNSGGEPLGETGWLDLTASTVVYHTDGTQGAAGTIGGAAGHFRVVIRLPDGLYFDQYRIVVWTTAAPQLVHHKVVGIRR